jgi:hypothetical protein
MTIAQLQPQQQKTLFFSSHFFLKVFNVAKLDKTGITKSIKPSKFCTNSCLQLSVKFIKKVVNNDFIPNLSGLQTKLLFIA